MYHIIGLLGIAAFFWYTNYIYNVTYDTDYINGKLRTLALLKQKNKAKKVLEGL